MSHRIAIVGAGNVGRALASGLAGAGHEVTLAVRDPGADRPASEVPHAPVPDAVDAAGVVILAIPAPAVGEAIPALPLRSGQVLLDATNAVRTPLPDGFETVGAFVASLMPSGVAYAKAFNTIGAEFLADGRRAGDAAFLPVAGDDDARAFAAELGADLGFDVAELGGRSTVALVEAHARLWIHLAFDAGWGRGFAFAVRRT